MKEEVNIIPTKFKEVDRLVNTYKRDGKNVKVDARLFDIIEFKGTIKNNELRKHRSMKFINVVELKKIKNISIMTKLALKYLS